MKKKAIKIVVPVIVAMLTIILIICCGSMISPSSDVIAQPTITTSTAVTTTATTTKTKITKVETTTTVQRTKVKNTTTVTTEKIVTTVVESIVTNKQLIEEYIVYKPDTHYVHDNTCHWAMSGRIERIETTEGIESRKCSECNPEIEIVTEYVEPIPEVTINTNSDRDLLAQIVWHEAGSDWIGTYDKAMVAAGVMNRVNDSRFPSTVYSVLTQPGQFTGFTPWTCTPTQSCYDAVDYYFNNVSSFGNHNSWYGDGVSNHFYYQ